MPPSRKRSGSNAKFPVRLHDMMTFAEEQGLESVIGWVLGGRGFIIHDAKKLIDVLPHFFGQTKYKSFLRQLNMWDFERVSHGSNKGTYMHPYFVKGNRDLCGLMTRQMKRFCADPTSSTKKLVTGESDTDLGSFKTEITTCNLPLTKGIGNLPGRAVEPAITSNNENSTRTASQGRGFVSSPALCRLLRGEASAASTMETEEDVKIFLGESRASFPFAVFAHPDMHHFAPSLDLEPSPIITTVTNSSVVDDKLMEYFFDDSSVNLKQCNHSDTSGERSRSLYSPAVTYGDNKPVTSESNLLGCFAGKQFFVVHNNSL